MPRIDIPNNSDTAVAAAKALDPTPALVIVSMNMDAGTFETRIYGQNARFRVLAGRMADICLAAIDAAEPDADSDFNWSLLAAGLKDSSPPENQSEP